LTCSVTPYFLELTLLSCVSYSYELPGHVISNMSRLHAAVTNFMQKDDELFIKVW